jgi:carotenoid 1,2-hydratase
MTERRRTSVTRGQETLEIGPSGLSWDGDGLTVRFDEVTSPRPSRLSGVIRLRPRSTNTQAYALDEAGRHRWRPIAPRAQVDVALSHPALTWRGDGYFDANAGDEPMENAFSGWDWSRAHLPSQSLLFYDVARRSGEAASLAMSFDRHGQARSIEPPPRLRLPATSWRIPRQVRGEPSGGLTLQRTLEDTPFYARSALEARFGGERADIVHESLSLDRLRSPIVRAMLPLRMPRVLW